ncbi:hypothetical protein NPX13_g1543 [Xylaria arbuscula]|uniref:AA1-like domain-containing protein n=1 Tax=Xylaria arbuscula TaxID=114810 RepID=A0A9W8TQ13_9PEZI|nr:hypothetical protein NPX13_g1543 [Xylaria arbuscula]
MRTSLTFLTVLIAFTSPFSIDAAHHPEINVARIPPTTLGNVDCSAASINTTFQLIFISYGNWTALSGDGESPQHLESISFAVSNPANAVSTTCAFSLDAALVWQACADRKDTDRKHIFTIATEAAFQLAEKSLAINQTWFCHDDAGRLVAFTGTANTVLDFTCSESEVSGYHLQNCTSSDLSLPVLLL